jgi:hypothetical protein
MKALRVVVFEVLVVVGACLLGARPAAASAPTYCSQEWYFHAPFPVGGGVWAWATCVPNGTPSSDPHDVVTAPGAGPIVGIDMIELRGSIDGVNYVVLGVNYMNGGTLVPWQDTTIAAWSCQPGAWYVSRFHWYRPDTGSWQYLNTTPIQRC